MGGICRNWQYHHITGNWFYSVYQIYIFRWAFKAQRSSVWLSHSMRSPSAHYRRHIILLDSTDSTATTARAYHQQLSHPGHFRYMALTRHKMSWLIGIQLSLMNKGLNWFMLCGKRRGEDAWLASDNIRLWLVMLALSSHIVEWFCCCCCWIYSVSVIHFARKDSLSLSNQFHFGYKR